MQSLNELRNLIRTVIQEELDDMDETSQAAKDAKSQGLTNMGFGRWGKDGKVTHKSDNGKLVKFTRAGMEKQTGLKFGRGAEKDMLRKGNVPQAKMTDPGKLQRIRPRNTPDDNRAANKPKDSLGHAPGEFRHEPGGQSIAAQKIVSKINHKLYDMDLSPYFHQDMPMDDFSKLTGLNSKQISAYDKYAPEWDRAFSIRDRAGTKSVYVYNPEDL
jgi:hypothetical protein